MSKPLKIQITVPKPCSEDWDKMTTVRNGKFCGHCQKKVIDFTAYTDKELIEFFSTNRERVCGSYYPWQLDRAIASNSSRPQPSFQKLLLSSAIAAGIAGNSVAQNNSSVNKQKPQTQTSTNVAGKQSSHASITYHHITGVVIDSSTGEPLTVMVALDINGKRFAQTMSDSAGKYTFTVKSSALGKRITIIAAEYNYAQKSVTMTVKKFPVKVRVIQLTKVSSDPVIITYRRPDINPVTVMSRTTGDSVCEDHMIMYNGLIVRHYQNGNIKSKTHYKLDKKNGIEKIYYMNGILQSKTRYRNDTIIWTKKYDEKGKKTTTIK